MRVVVQRVNNSSVRIKEEIVGSINDGLLVLLGVTEGDDKTDVDYLVDKIINLRIFSDAEGKMNLSLLDKNYEILVVSQFTLYGDCRKGRRPSFTESAKPEVANQLYEQFVSECKTYGINVQTGVFGGDMQVELVNDGPVTLIIDSDFRKS